MTNWKEYKLGDLLMEKPKNGLYKANTDSGKKVRYIKMSDLYSNEFISNQKTETIDVTIDENNKFNCIKNDLLFGRTSLTFEGIGKCVLVKNINDTPVYESNIFRIRPNCLKVSPTFLFYFFKSNIGRDYLLSIASQTAATSIRSSEMVNLNINIPDLPTQTAIAEILSSLDDKIELNNKINQELENLAQTLFKQWFIDFEFPDENGNSYKSSGGEMVDSELEEIPKEWEVGNISKIGANVRDNLKPKGFNSTIPYIGLEHIPRKSLSISNWGISTDVDSNKSKFKRKDILFGKLRPYFHKVITAPFDGICSTDILVVRPIRDIYYGYLLFHLFSDEIIAYSTNVSGGTRMPRVSWKDIAKYKICLPPENVLLGFTLLIENFEAQIQINIKENQELTNLRDTLLPKLISGELEINNVNV